LDYFYAIITNISHGHVRGTPAVAWIILSGRKMAGSVEAGFVSSRTTSNAQRFGRICAAQATFDLANNLNFNAFIGLF
jgi:hypothetical protein